MYIETGVNPGEFSSGSSLRGCLQQCQDNVCPQIHHNKCVKWLVYRKVEVYNCAVEGLFGMKNMFSLGNVEVYSRMIN